jgi:hypothetical protein
MKRVVLAIRPGGDRAPGLASTRKRQTDANALRWLNNAIDATEKNLETAKIEEEARGY